MEILTIKDKNYNVVSMRDIFEILDSNGMNEVGRYIRHYLTSLTNEFYGIRDLFSDPNEDGNVEIALENADIFKNLLASIDEVVS